MNNKIKSTLIPLAMSFAFAIPLVSSVPNAEARKPRTIVQTAQGTYKCHKAGLLGKKLSCKRMKNTVRR